MNTAESSVPTKASVVAIGAAGVDVLGHQSQAGLAADSVPGAVQRAPGGVARNVAETLARLDVPVTLVSLIGDDADGDWLLANTAAAGVDVSLVRRTSALPTSTYLAVHDHQGRMTAAVSDMRLCERLTAAELQPVTAVFDKATAVVVDANLSAGVLEWLGKQCASTPLFADAVSAVKAPRLQAALPRLHTVKLNLAEARALLGEPQADWRTCCARLCEQGARRVVVSLGEAGIAYGDGEQEFHRAAPRGPIHSDTGAGDALMAGLVAAWVAGLKIEAQLDYALACAGVALQSETAVQTGLTVARVRAWIEEHL